MHHAPTHQLSRLGSLLSATFALTALAALGAQSPAAKALSAPRFVENAGQWNSPESFRLRAGGLEVFLEKSGWTFRIQESASADASAVPPGAKPGGGVYAQPTARRSTAVRMSFVGGEASALRAENLLPGTTNFLSGADASSHRRDVRSYESVLYSGLRQGIDVRARSASGHFEYDLLVSPDAPLAQVVIRVEGVESLQLNAAGELVLNSALGAIVQPKPTTWMVATDGGRIPIACNYELLGKDRFRFVAPDRDASRPLVVDPPLIYSSYLGGTGEDIIRAITEDSQGRFLVCGQTDATDFPTTVGGLQPATAGTWDGFLACIDPSLPPANQLVFSTYFGGVLQDDIRSVIALASGNIAFGGYTQNAGLPTTAGAFQSTHAGGIWDGIYGVLDPSGSALLALTYFGGSGDDFLLLTPHSPGIIAMCGQTRSADLPIVGAALQPTLGGGNDGFFGLMDESGSAVLASSYLGGSGDDWATCGDVDANGVMAIHGATNSLDFPVTANAFQSSFKGGLAAYWWAADAFVALVNPLLSGNQQLVYGSYFGSSQYEHADQARFASNGDIVICGTAQSTSLPTTLYAHQPNHAGGAFINANYIAGDAFVARLNPSAAGSAGLVYSTYVGGNRQDQGLDCVVDSDGVVTLVGWTQGVNGGSFSTTPDAIRRTYAFNDGYVAQLSADGTQLLHATLLGGTDHDGSWYVERHADRIVNLASATFSSNYPTENPVQATFAGSTDAVVSRLRTDSIAVSRFGVATPRGTRKPTIHAMGDAVSGNAAFGIACSKAPANSFGSLGFANNNSSGLPVLGFNLLLDPNSIAVIFTVSSGATGESVTPLPLPVGSFGKLYVQYVWIEDFATFALSASEALELF